MSGQGRPSIYTLDLADTFLARLAEGRSVRSICRDDDMPVTTTIFRWLREDESFKQRYEVANEARAHALAEDILEIADDGKNDWMEKNDPENPGYRVNGEHVQRSRLRVDSRKWLASKILPKNYGDKTTTEVHGKDGKDLIPEMTDTDLARLVAFTLARGAAAVAEDDTDG